jgi:Tfp pilus assembly protein PilF
MVTSSPPQQPAALESEALRALQAGDPKRAEALLRQALALTPAAPGLLSALGHALAEQRRLEEALACHRRAAELAPGNTRLQANLGNNLCQLGRLEEGLEAFDTALANEPATSPAASELHFNKGNALRALGRRAPAATAYRAALAAAPGALAVLINLGGLLCEMGELSEAEAQLRQALALDPTSALARSNLAMVLGRRGLVGEATAILEALVADQPENPQARLQLGQTQIAAARWSAARSAVESALALQPNLPEAYVALGEIWKAESCWAAASDAYLSALRLTPRLAQRRLHYKLGLQALEAGAYDEAAGAMLAPLWLERGPNSVPAPGATLDSSRIKLIHDLEQLRHLQDEGILDKSFSDVIAAYSDALAQLPSGHDNRIVGISARAFPQVVANASRLNHVEPAPALPGGALNPDLDSAAIAAAFRARPLGATYVDGLLKPEALEALRRFCNRSTVWWQHDHTGELGSLMHRGFACPLLAQIAHELRRALPELLGPHPFTSLWAYKYFATPEETLTHGRSSGLDIHADDGAITVNFWIAPDKGNRDPNSGGVCLWDREAPPAYFETATREERLAIVDGLMRDAAPPDLVIPHRANRAAIFHSNSLHRSDKFLFDDAFPNRKISITVMFGQRATG